jgi:hypothetical protein
MTTTDPVTLTLTGEIPFILIASGCVGLLSSFVLLQLYRRAVRRGMARTSGNLATSQATGAARMGPPAPPTPLAIAYAGTGGRDPAVVDSSGLYSRARTAPWRSGAVYGSAGAVFAATLTFAFLWSSGTELTPLRFLVLFWVFVWPVVFTLSLVAATTRREKVLVATGYTTGCGALALAVLITSPDSSPSQLIVLWIAYDLPPSLLFSAFLLRRVRAVGPLVVTFLVFSFGGTSFLLDALGRNPGALRSVVDFFVSLGLGGIGIYTALIVTGLIFFGVVGWFLLQWLRRGYQAKWVNDQSLVLDALWLFFGVSYSVEFAFEGPAWASAGLVAFVLYLATVRLGFRLSMPHEVPEGKSLLVLRVFSLGKRSETLFRNVSRHWRYIGTVQLIAGPDLAAATIEPHEFLDFASGRLKRQFINDTDDLSRRLGKLDTAPDFDGRFRVNDFFCHDDTWQPTLAALVHHSNAVFMDLREFTSTRQGVVYEIQQLLQYVPLARIVVLVDLTTDRVSLDRAVTAAWRELPTCSPNWAAPDPRLTVIEGDRETGSSPHALLAAICRAATT